MCDLIRKGCGTKQKITEWLVLDHTYDEIVSCISEEGAEEFAHRIISDSRNDDEDWDITICAVISKYES